MRSCHDQIPKLSVRAAAKAPRASQQERLDAEKRRLLVLQQEWQLEIAGLVAEFESVDAARFEHVRESVLKYEHYRSEFFKATQTRSSAVAAAAQGLRPQARVAAAVARPTTAGQAAAGAAHDSSAELPLPDDTSDKSATRGFLKLGIFRSKTKRVKKKASAASHSVASSDMSVSRGASGSIESPEMGGPAAILGVRSAHELGTADAGVQDVAADVAAHPQTLGRNSSSFASSPSPQHSDRNVGDNGPGVSAHESSGDAAEWVITGHTQDSPGRQLVDQELSADSLVHVSRLSVIDETSDKTHSSPMPAQHDASPSPAQAQHDPPALSTPNGQDEAADTTATPEPPVPESRSLPPSRFDDVFTSLEPQGPPGPHSDDAGGAAVAAADVRRAPSAPLGGAQVDLDSAFAVPSLVRSQTAAKPEPSADARPASVGHRHNASLGQIGGPSAASAAQESDDEGAEVEHSFRVNFSIRERAIQDNPDETRAALSRVATMLRAAPSARRRNRREVRTVYVDSDARSPAQAAAIVGSDQPEAAQELPAAAVPSLAPEKIL
ncbi:hypothetical protein H4R21_003147, partial [Coemansia helicoidea]